MHEYHLPVVSYEDDVFVWVYLDQIDRIVRYEAFVVDYDEHGLQTTLKFVIEEGVLDNAHEVPLIQEFIQRYEEVATPSHAAQFQGRVFPSRGALIAAPSLRYLYTYLNREQIERLHEYFAAQEAHLKRDKKARWMRSLRALGFEVVATLT